MASESISNHDSDSGDKTRLQTLETLSPDMEKRGEDDLHGAAERGFVVTDHHGESLVQFDPEAERKLRNKLDYMIVPTVSILYLFCFIDRANIGNARLAGFEKDLGLVGYDYNTVLSIFYISYIVFEIPSNLACKWIGPGWFIPAISLGFGVSSLGTAFVRTKAAACGVRFVLGIFEAGMMPGISYYLSRWYRRSELTFRLSLFIVMAPLAGAFGGLLASGILTLDHFGGLHSWRMIFGIEGIITIGLSIISFFTLTDRPESARWLTQAEKDLAIARVKSERMAQTHLLDKPDKDKLWLGFWNPMVLSTAFIFLLNNITVQGLAFFTPTIVSDSSRSIAIGTNVMFGNVGGLISTWSYLPYDGPDYKIGNGINLAAASLILIVSALQLVWMKWDNRRREGKDIDSELQGRTQAEIESLEWKHPGFRWRP